MRKTRKVYVIPVNMSVKKGTPKTPVREIILIKDIGVKGDAHQGS